MRCAITVRGKVQDAGYRKIIEENAKIMGIRGYVFNDIDKTVKVVCEGQTPLIEELLETINIHRGSVSVDRIDKIEVFV